MLIRLISFVVLLTLVSSQCASKQVLTSDGSCLPCHYTCAECSALTNKNCTSCELEYYMGPTMMCLQCPLNCRICNNSANCTSCNTGFYLDYNQQCQPCANGTLTCTMSSIGLCSPGYFLTNLGYSHCVACTSGCYECASSSTCATCLTGYLSNGLCLNCSDPNCLSCYGSDYCQTCIDGWATDQYGKCNIQCAQGCRSCVSSAVCMECLSTYYLSGYVCLPGGSILCQTSSSPSSCASGCLSSTAYTSVTGNVCIIRSTVNVTTRQYYLSAVNSLSSFWSSQLLNCTPTQIASAQGQLLILQSIKAGYSVTVYYQLFILSTTNLTAPSYVVSTPFSNITQNASLSPTFSIAQTCSQYSYMLSTSSSATFSVLTTFNSSAEPFQLMFSLTDSSAVGISQLIISVALCGVPNCGSCSTSKDCLACQPPYYLEINTCVSVCSFGLYTNPVDRSCLASCPDLYYSVRQEYLCVLCVSPCRTCSSQTYCLSCVNGTYLNSQNSCVSSCSDATLYGNPSTLKCQSCIYPCKYCSVAGTNCTGCLIGFLNQQNHSCTLKCPDGFYGKMDTLLCESCMSPCLSCMMTSLTCTSCIAGLSLANGQCLASCPSQTFSAGGICQSCQDPCQECVNSSSQCTTCKRGFLQNSSCLEQCPTGMYGSADLKICVLCDPSCIVCQGNSLNCTQCQASFVLFQTSCLTTCPEGYYNRSGQCIVCQSPCMSCFNQTACKSCQPSLYMYGITCNMVCPNGSYASTTNNYVCLSCPANCSLCSAISGTLICTNCTFGYFLQNGTCSLACSAYSFANTIERRCDKCAAPCATCSTNVDRCNSCILGYSLLLAQNLCYNICPKGYYNDANYVCTACVSPCNECTNQTACLTCVNGTYLINTTCLASCPNGTYADGNTLTCTLCSLPCQTCLSQQLCLSCVTNSGYPFLYVHSCVNSCPLGSIGQLSLCLPCSSNCQVCIGVQTNCTSCKKGYYLFAGNASCIATCPDGYFASNAMGSCSPCKQMCLTCLTYSYCTSCTLSPKAFLFDSGCGYSCPSGYYEDLSNSSSYVCTICHSNCTECSIQPNNCTVCKTGAFMPVGVTSTFSCLSGCPALSFSFNAICIACSSPCLSCASPDLCITCLASYALYNTSCLTVCPPGFYNASGICSSCTLPCSECSKLATNCTACIASMLLYNYTCVSACPSHYYVSAISSVCLVCSPLCLECSDYTFCTSCNSTSQYFLLEASTCVQSCSQAHYLVNQTCWNCSTNCVECTNSTNCVRCITAYLYNGFCIQTCPNLTYPDISLACLICQSPCENCLDSQTCVTCREGFLLYLTNCITKCPDKYWADRYSRRCVLVCDAVLFRNVATMECFKTCPQYYTSDSFCASSCPAVINRTMGCQDCAPSVCDDLTMFKAVYFMTQGKMQFAIVFSKPLTLFSGVVPTLFNVALQTKTFINAETETIPRRLLANVPVNIQSVGPSLIGLITSYGSIQTTTATVTLTNQTVLQRNNYPIQNTVSTVEINYYRQYSQYQLVVGQYFLVMGRIIAYIVLALGAFNYLLDNLRATVLLTESVQIYYFMSYLKIWYCPVLEKLLQGFERASFRIELPFDFQLMLWNSRPKNLLLSTDINFFRSCLGTVLAYLGFFIVSLLLRVICKAIKSRGISKILKHELCWNHINDGFWLFGFNIGLFALFQLIDVESSAACAFAASIAVTLFVGMSFVLFYVTVKCVYSKNFSEETFFWAHDTTHIKNSLGHMTTTLFLIRRVIIVFSIGIAGENPLYCLFLLLMINLLIIFNNIINSPYKRHSIVILLRQVVFVAVVLVLGSLSIFTMDERMSWAIGIAASALILLDILLGIGVVLIESQRVVRKIWRSAKQAKASANVLSPNDGVENEEASQNQCQQTSQEMASAVSAGQKLKKINFLLPNEIPKLNLEEAIEQPVDIQQEKRESSNEDFNIIVQQNFFESQQSESDGFARPADYLLEVPKEQHHPALFNFNDPKEGCEPKENE